MKLRICLFTLGAKAQKKPVTRYSPRNNLFSCKICAVKHSRAPEPFGILNTLLIPQEGDTTLYTCQSLSPDAERIVTHKAFQKESGCEDLGDSNPQ